MKTEKTGVALRSIMDGNAFQFRQGLDEENIGKILYGLRAGETLPCMVVTPLSATTYEVVSGHHLLAAYRQFHGKKNPTLPVEVVRGTVAEVTMRSIEANVSHGLQYDKGDYPELCAFLRTEYGLSNVAIAKKLRVSEGSVRNYIGCFVEGTGETLPQGSGGGNREPITPDAMAAAKKRKAAKKAKAAADALALKIQANGGTVPRTTKTDDEGADVWRNIANVRLLLSDRGGCEDAVRTFKAHMPERMLAISKDLQASIVLLQHLAAAVAVESPAVSPVKRKR